MPELPGPVTALAYRAGATAAQLVPASIATPLARAIGRASAPLMPAQRRMAARHQRRAVSDREGSAGVGSNVEGVFDSYGRYWLEMLRLPAEVRSGAVAAHFSIEGFEHIEEGLERGKGVIVALPHLGGWEWGVAPGTVFHSRVGMFGVGR